MNSQLRADQTPLAEAAGNEAAVPVSATVVRPVLPRYVLRGVSGAGFGRTFPLIGPTILGRGPDCGIHLDHPGVSREHARLTPTDEGLLVEDLGSTNGLLINETRHERALARHGDEIGIDVMRFRVVAPGEVDAALGRPSAQARGDGSKTRAVSLAWWAAALLVLAAVAVLVLR